MKRYNHKDYPMKRYNHSDYPMDMEEDENGYWVTYNDCATFYENLIEELHSTSKRIDELSADYNQSRSTLLTQVNDLEVSYNTSLKATDQYYKNDIKLHKFLSFFSIAITLIVLTLSLFQSQQLI